MKQNANSVLGPLPRTSRDGTPADKNDDESTPRRKRQCGARSKSLWIAIIIGIVMVAMCEIGFFNLGHWRTVGLQHATVGESQLGEGLASLGGGRYRITDPEEATITVPVSDNGKPVDVESLRIVVGDTETPGASTRASVQLKTTTDNTATRDAWVDGRDSDGGWMDGRHIFTYSGDPADQYYLIGKKLQTYESTEVRITFLEDEDSVVSFERLEVNPTIPFRINPLRLAFELVVAAFFVLFRPTSSIYRAQVDLHSVRQRIALAVYVIGLSAIAVLVTRIGGTIQGGFHGAFRHIIDPNQYQHLADALLHGHAWLDLPVDPSLSTMDNPYNYFERLHLAQQGHQYYWDYAFHGGKYYCYFGVVPALFTFVPYQLVTGAWMPTWYSIALSSVLAIVFGALLVRRIAHDYFPRASLGIVWLVTIGFSFGTCIFTYCFSSTFYNVPMACALALVLMGLWFWQISKREDGSVNGWYVAAGSLCMALLLGTRPQFILAWVLAFPLFWPQITKYRTLFSKRGVCSTICALVPFIVVSIPLMYYNYIRFGSWTDFGAYYNLTVYDLSSRNASKYTLLPALFTQLFQPPSTTSEFPFLTTTDTVLAGPNEPSTGGYFAAFPIALMALLFILVRQQLRKRHVWGMSIMLMVLAFIAVLFDTYKSGTSMRYYGDFGYLVMLCMVFVALSFADAAQEAPGLAPDGSAFASVSPGPYRTLGFRTLQTVLVTLVVLTAVMTLVGLLVPGRFDSWASMHPRPYNAIRSWFIGLTA
ncbi:glycosyltransferase [Bifidobacterium criceti]|uniref:PMT family glycosyltransferase n=1 Tax=Bifidobacterium criceti TaxID=1960969 RepID=A0A2A2EIJ4_9BIFI|nr:glycosyltransferase [Bifidobacterium criceti]PAU68780.1 PMT family glycosyltransferase [Bifidobacterium criceti]